MRRKRRDPDNPDLFTWVPPEPPETTSYARSTDPETSHEAARKISFSKMEQTVYDVLAETGERMTSLCITRYLDRHGDNRAWSVSPRLRPLEEKGAIKRDGKMTVENSNGRDAKLTAWIVVKKTTDFARPGQERPPAHQVDITAGYGD